MISGKVSHQLNEQFDVSHVVQQVRVLKFLWLFKSNGLLELTSTFTISAYQGVVDHLALDTFQILDLIANYSSIH